MGWFSKKDGENKDSSQSSFQLPKLPELPELPPLDMGDRKDYLSQLPSFPNSSFGDNFSRNTIKDAVSGKPKDEFNIQFPQENRENRVFKPNNFSLPNKKEKQMMQKSPQQKKDYIFPRTQEIEDDEEFDSDDSEEGSEEPEFSEYEESYNPDKAKFTPPKARYSQPKAVYSTPKTKYEEPEIDNFEPRSRGGMSSDEPVYIRIDKFEEAMKAFEKTKKEIADIEKSLKDITAVREDEDKELELWQQNIIKIKDQIDQVHEDIFSKIE